MITTRNLLLLFLPCLIFAQQSNCELWIPRLENDKFGYIDTNNNQMIEAQYDFAYPFNLLDYGKAKVVVKGKEYLIDDKGKIVQDFESFLRQKQNENLYGFEIEKVATLRYKKIEKNGKYGIVGEYYFFNKNISDTIFQPILDRVSFFEFDNNYAYHDKKLDVYQVPTYALVEYGSSGSRLYRLDKKIELPGRYSNFKKGADYFFLSRTLENNDKVIQDGILFPEVLSLFREGVNIKGYFARLKLVLVEEELDSNRTISYYMGLDGKAYKF